MTKIQEAIAHFEHGITRDIYSEPVTTYAKAAVSALRAQQEAEKIKPLKQNKWINAKDKLPKDGREVLTYYGFDLGDGDLGMRFFGVLSYLAFEAQPHWQNADTGLCVTHWMPLPEPPEESPDET